MDKRAKQQLPSGIDVRGDRIRILFSWNGKRHREPYPFPATPENIRRAARLANEIKNKIRMRIFMDEDFFHYFPNSTHAESSHDEKLFHKLAQAWIDSLSVGAGTRVEYKKSLNKYWLPTFGHRRIDSIKYSELRALINKIPWSSMKTRNNCLIPLRGVFDMAFEDEIIDRSPMDRVKNMKHQKNPPDPFSMDEANAIIAALYKDYIDAHAIFAAYFEFAFWSGLRTGELLALTWDNIDLRAGYVRVQRARSKGFLKEQTKTATVRDVLLNDRARAALFKAQALTFERGGYVFKSPHTGEPFITEKSQRTIFGEVLRELGIRHRRPYNTRHTYATVMLMAGVNPAFVAAQLGHSVTMTLTVYSKWISGKSDANEMAKLSAFVPNLSQDARK